MNWRQQVQYQYNMSGIVERLIAVNVIAFVLMYLLKTVEFLFQLPADTILEWLVFPRNVSAFLFKPWTVVTYAFLHAGFWHIISNMLVLYFAGTYFLTFFSPKQLLNYYFLGAIAGALMFMGSYNFFPVFSNMGDSYLIGASAAVMAILIGVATQAPQMRVRLFFFSVKLWWIAAFFIVSDIAQIPFGNPGGHLAHLGGALLGFVYTKQLSKGNDIGRGFERIMDWIVGIFSSKRSKPFKTVYRNKAKTTAQRGDYSSDTKAEKQKKIDAILDKISKNGYDSLTKDEKDFLFNAGKEG